MKGKLKLKLTGRQVRQVRQVHIGVHRERGPLKSSCPQKKKVFFLGF